jgi:tight adherence protein B
VALAIIFLLAVLLAAGAIWLFVHAGKREREEEVLLRLRAMGGDEAAYVMQSDSARPHNIVLRWACHLAWRTGAELSADTVARILLVIVVLATVAVLVLGVFGGISAIAILLALGWAWLNRQGALRRARIVEQLPAFIEGVIRVLGAGNTLDEAISAAARECTDPIRPLFLSVGRQVRLGAPIEAVLMETAEIHQLRDLKVLALAAAINRKYGGSLRNLLRSLIHAVRARRCRARAARTHRRDALLGLRTVGHSGRADDLHFRAEPRLLPQHVARQRRPLAAGRLGAAAGCRRARDLPHDAFDRGAGVMEVCT